MSSIFLEVNETGIVHVSGDLDSAELAVRLRPLIQNLDLAIQEVLHPEPKTDGGAQSD